MKKFEKLETLAESLGTLKDRVVFSGGMLTAFYATDAWAHGHRSMGELECILNAPTMAEFLTWDRELRERGFHPKYDPNPPVIEWEYKGIGLEVYPSRPEIVRHKNRWFEEGVFHAIKHPLPSGICIRIMSAPYFLASRIESFLHHSDFYIRHNKDFEDIVFLLNNRPELLDEVAHSFHEVRAYIQGFFYSLLNHKDLREGLYYALPFNGGSSEAERILWIMEEMGQNPYALV